MQCHYEVLNVAQDADAATIKKAHRKLAIKLHPDKNLNDEAAAEKFRLVQEAYECLSDAAERRWYDEHRDALLKGWSPNTGGQEGGESMIFDVIPFMHAHCYTGYDDNDEKSFYGVYGHVFASLAKEEADGTSSNGNKGHELPREFGNSKTDLRDVANFYQVWESFVSELTFSWADQYDVKEAENRRIRRAMEEENKKARKAARKARNEDIIALVRFCKRRDPRMKELKEKQEQEKRQKEQRLKEQQVAKKEEKLQAREQWLQQAEEAMAKTEEMDRLAGRVRLADLEDDYDYGGGKKKGKKKNKNKKNQQLQQQENEDDDEDDENEAPAEDQGDDNTDENGIGDGEEERADPAELEDALAEEEEVFSEESESSEEEEPDFWRCECCRKEFKSEGQMDNHMKSKKHKEAYKKYQKKLEKELMRE